MTDETLISGAREILGEDPVTVLDACEAFYMNGLADDVCGDVDLDGHYYRVERWIVRTDDLGFHHLDSYPSVETAKRVFGIIERQFEEDEE